MTKKERRVLVIILILFIILGIYYAIITPVFEASDELWHYPMIAHLADGNPLPVQVMDPNLAGPWKQEASQPPLYYYLGAALTFWIDTSDLEEVRKLNPHVDNGILTQDGNINLVVHDPEANAWQGTELAVRIVRFFSVGLGAVTVYLTYRIAKAVTPSRSEIPLGAAAVNAFIPMFLFISGAVNNDNLVIPLASLALLIMIYIAKDSGINRKREYLFTILLGLVIGLAALSKITALGLILIATLALFIGRWARSGRDSSINGLVRIFWGTSGRVLLLIIFVLVVSGWWYFRNIRLYGDWTGWNAFIAVLGRRAHPAGLAQLWDERWGFMLSFWGLFGGLNVDMPEWIYRLLNYLAIASAVGFLFYLGGIVRYWIKESEQDFKRAEYLFQSILELIEDNVALILCLLWSAAVTVGLIRWATITWSSQGRLVFSSISALSILFVVGLTGWMPRRPARIVLGMLASFLFVISLLAPWLWIGPAYDPGEYESGVNLQAADITFGDSLKLKAYALDTNRIQPGDAVDVWLQWEVVEELDKDWSVFVHLNDSELGAPIAQRDMYLGQGLLASSMLEKGDIILNNYRIILPQTAVAPADLSLDVGLYDFYSGERLNTDLGTDFQKIAALQLESVPGTVPNPVSINFENELQLIGYDILSRRVLPGEALELQTHWEAQDLLEKDYTFFAQLVDEDTTRWASQDLTLPTSTWKLGEVHTVDMSLVINQVAPAGVYPIIVGAYTRPEDGSFDRLQTVVDGRLTDDFVQLVEVRIGGF